MYFGMLLAAGVFFVFIAFTMFLPVQRICLRTCHRKRDFLLPWDSLQLWLVPFMCPRCFIFTETGGPSPYSSGPMMGQGGMSGGMSGGMYPMPPIMDRFGLGLPMGHTAIGSRPGLFQDENPPRKSADSTRDSDWTCPNYGNINFSFRTVCNMRKCSTPVCAIKPHCLFLFEMRFKNNRGAGL